MNWVLKLVLWLSNWRVTDYSGYSKMPKWFHQDHVEAKVLLKNKSPKVKSPQSKLRGKQ